MHTTQGFPLRQGPAGEAEVGHYHQERRFQWEKERQEKTGPTLYVSAMFFGPCSSIDVLAMKMTTKLKDEKIEIHPKEQSHLGALSPGQQTDSESCAG